MTRSSTRPRAAGSRTRRPRRRPSRRRTRRVARHVRVPQRSSSSPAERGEPRAAERARHTGRQHQAKRAPTSPRAHRARARSRTHIDASSPSGFCAAPPRRRERGRVQLARMPIRKRGAAGVPPSRNSGRAAVAPPPQPATRPHPGARARSTPVPSSAPSGAHASASANSSQLRTVAQLAAAASSPVSALWSPHARRATRSRARACPSVQREQRVP